MLANRGFSALLAYTPGANHFGEGVHRTVHLFSHCT
jgi:hypothetical protein